MSKTRLYERWERKYISHFWQSLIGAEQFQSMFGNAPLPATDASPGACPLNAFPATPNAWNQERLIGYPTSDMNWYRIHGILWESHGFWAGFIARTNHLHRVRNPCQFFGRGNLILESRPKLRTLKFRRSGTVFVLPSVIKWQTEFHFSDWQGWKRAERRA